MADAIAWVLLTVMAGAAVVALVVCARMAAANARAPRDANVRAGEYPIPYVIQLRGVRLALTIVFFVDLVLALLATRFPQGFPVLAIFSVVAPLMLWLVARYRLVLEPDVLRFRRVVSENVVSYRDLVSVAPEWITTARGAVVVVLKLGLTQKQKPISLPLTMISARERAVIVDRLQRCAPQATFSPDLHYLWTGKF